MHRSDKIPDNNKDIVEYTVFRGDSGRVDRSGCVGGVMLP